MTLDSSCSPLGRRLIEHGLLNAAQLGESVHAQRVFHKRGRVAPLGEILVAKKYVSRKAIDDALGGMSEVPMTCAACAAKFDGRQLDLSLTYRCKNCKGKLQPPEPEEEAPATQPLPSLEADRPTTKPETLVGRFEVHQQVGHGATGRVYRAWDPKSQRMVALKVLRPDLAGPPGPGDSTRTDERFLRFLREARTATQLRHPHIVQVYEVDEAEDQTFLCMEFVAGGNLGRYLPGPGKAAERGLLVLLRAFADVCGAVDYAHERGIIHRDLKPANILIRPEGDGRDDPLFPLVADFGLAHTAEAGARLTRTGQVLGTPEYMSPEQCDGSREIDRRSDVFALGIVLYELLTGARPFTGEHAMEVLHAVMNREPAPPSRHRPDLDPELAAMVMQALAKDPKRRPATARDLGGRVSRWVSRPAV